MSLADERCVPSRAGSPPLDAAESKRLHAELDDSWKIVDGHHLARDYSFPDFREALAFTNRVAAIAEEQGHHPEIRLGWGHVGLDIWTHAVGGLSRADFVLAARIDQVIG